MKTEDLIKLSTNDLLDLYEDFVKMRHYEATDEFDGLREHEFGLYEVKNEVKRRMGI